VTDLADRASERDSGVAAKILRRLAEAPAELVLVSYDGEDWPAARLRDAVARLRSAMPVAGRPLRVAAVMRNRPWHIAVLVAVMGNRDCLVLLSPLEPMARTVDDVRRLRPDVVVAEAGDLTAELLAAAADCGALTVALPGPGGEGDPESSGEWQRGLAGDVVGPDVAVLMLTSGTTGPAKRVPVRFADLTNAIDGAERHYVGKVVTGRRHQPSICPLPPVTISGLWAIVTALAGGAPLVLLDRFEPDAWSRLVEHHLPRTAGLPPAALRMILEAQIPAERLRSLTSIWCGAAPLDPALGRAFEAAYDVPVLQTYGATEFTGGLAGWSLPDWKKWSALKPGSVGRLHHGVTGRVVDPDTGADQSTGSVGLLAFRTPHTVGAGADEWVQTNDLGRIDADGFLFVDGRADDVINRGGFKVSAAKLKALLESHPDVVEAAIVPLPDGRLGDLPGALVVPRSGTTVTEADLERLVRDNLPPYYVPGILRFATELPRNGAMKIIRPAVVELLTS
jgi:acyl-coenzyme A synthetase/AMP-(fatty) acid ligase